MLQAEKKVKEDSYFIMEKVHYCWVFTFGDISVCESLSLQQFSYVFAFAPSLSDEKDKYAKFQED